MALVGALCAVGVGAVFVVAGASKVASGSRWSHEARALGAPAWATPLVPWWEIGVGATLAVGTLQPFPAAAALFTLAVFTTLLVRVLRRGQHPPCACFGAWSAEPLGWRHVARNVVLAALAALTVTIR